MVNIRHNLSIKDIEDIKKNMCFTTRNKNGPYNLIFDEGTEKKFGVSFLQRINTPKGLATVIGEYEGYLWFWQDTDTGISFWDNFNINNNDFKLSDNKDYPIELQQAIFNLFNIPLDLILKMYNIEGERNDLRILLEKLNIFTEKNRDAILEHPEKQVIIALINLIHGPILTSDGCKERNLEIFEAILNYRPSLQELLEYSLLLKKINLLDDKIFLTFIKFGYLPEDQQRILDKYLAVQTNIKKNSIKFGNKTANLIELDNLFKSKKTNVIHVQVPELFPIDDAAIHRHLDTYAPNWHVLWQEFLLAQENKKTLQPEALRKLNVLQDVIIDCFKQYPFNPDRLNASSLPKDTIFMVRSTGDEDKVDLANPGGNKSVAAVKFDNKTISDAIGKVVASYFSEKSLTQRLLSNDDITKEAFLPVLIQKMIGERINSDDPNQIVVSGVMYAKDKMTRIEAAPGHGELIVNSKAPFDTYDVTAEQIVHSEICKKQKRLIPIELQNGRRKLVFKDNPKDLQANPSLPLAIAKEIANIGQAIATHYGLSMDIEFVYEPSKNILYLVQARPIPQSTDLYTKPLSIAPAHWSQIKANADIEKIKVKVISHAGDVAKIITNKEEVLFHKSIGQALNFYLNHPDIQSKIRGVIIKEPAPSNSHEAAQFNALGIPVLQAKTKTIKAWLKTDHSVIIIDPQRKHVVNLTSQIKNYYNAEQELLNEKILVSGMFSSSSTTKKTLLPISYKLSKAIKKQIKKYLKCAEIQIDKKQVYKNLLEYLDVIEAAKPSDQNQEAFLALQKVAAIFKAIGTSTQSKDDSLPHKKIFVHAILSIAEIDQCLKTYSSIPKNESAEKIQYHLLDLICKLKALVNNPGEKDLYSDSLIQIAGNNKVFLALNDHNVLTKTECEFLHEFIKLSAFALRKDTEEQWNAFSYHCSKSALHRQILAKIVMQMNAYHLESELINNLFLKYLKDSESVKILSKDYNRILLGMLKEVIDSQKEFTSSHFHENNDIIAKWEKKITEWSRPNKFDLLFKDFEREIIPLIDRISFDDRMSPLTQNANLKQAQLLAELIDKTIKSMKGSSYYNKTDTSLVIERFIKLLEPYHHLMQTWMNKIPEEKYNKWSSKINADDFYNSKDNMIKKIGLIFKSKSSGLGYDVKELHPSGTISIASATVGSTASFYRQVVERQDNLTLEDLFSLFHQNILASLVILQKKNKTPLSHLPAELQVLLQVLQSRKKISLLGMRHEPPKVYLEYNMPLSNHSAKFILEYNIQTKTLLFHGSFFGKNWSYRMNLIARIAAMEGILLNSKFLYTPVYNSENLNLNFTWQFAASQIDRLAGTINDIVDHYGFLTENQDECDAFVKLLNRYLLLENPDKFFQGLSSKNFELLQNKFELINKSLKENLIIQFPSLICLSQSMMDESITPLVFHLANMPYKDFMECMYKGNFNNLKGQFINNETFFKRLMNCFTANEILNFIQKEKLNSGMKSFAATQHNMEALIFLLEHGIPLSYFNLDIKSILFLIKDARFSSVIYQYPDIVFLNCKAQKIDVAMCLATEKARQFMLSADDMNAIFKHSTIENCLENCLLLIKDWPKPQLQDWLKENKDQLEPAILNALSADAKQQMTSAKDAALKLDSLEDKIRFIFSKTSLAPLLNKLEIKEGKSSTRILFADCIAPLTSAQKEAAISCFNKFKLKLRKVNVTANFCHDGSPPRAEFELFLTKDKLESLLTVSIATQFKAHKTNASKNLTAFSMFKEPSPLANTEKKIPSEKPKL